MICVICQRRETDAGQVCPSDRAGLAAALRDLVHAHAALARVDPQLTATSVLVDDDGTFDAPRAYQVLDVGAGPIRASTGAPPVSGSRTAPVPITIDAVDLTAAARAGAVHDALVPLVETREVLIRVRRVERRVVVHKWRDDAGEERERREVVPVVVDEIQRRIERVPVHAGYGQPVMVPARDQIGQLGVATILDQWVGDWIGERNQREHRPEPTVGKLARWLSDRLDWACDHHPAVDDFADEIRDALAACKRLVGEGPEPQPEPCKGVPCRRCDLTTLVRLADGSGDVECANPDCRAVMSADEYQRWTRLLAADARRGRRAGAGTGT